MAKRRARVNGKKTHTLANGDKVFLTPVAPGLLQAALSGIIEPSVPMWYNEDKGREEENPNDPTYLAALNNIPVQQSKAMLDCAILFGAQLVDGVPPEEEWLPKLKFLIKLKHLDLSDYDLEDELEREFVYKKFIAFGKTDFDTVSDYSGITEEDVAEAAAGFRDQT